MNRPTLALVLSAAPLASGCLSVEGSPYLPMHEGSGFVGSYGVVAPAEPAAPVPPAQAPVQTSDWTEEELDIWNSSIFRKHFLQSYIAETDIEPRLTTVELADIQEVLDMISDDRTDEAVKIIDENRNGAGSAVWDQTLGNIFFQREQWDQATWAYEAAVDKYPKFRRAWKNLGIVLVRREEYASAARAFSQVVSLGGGDGLMYGLLGFSYGKIDNHISSESAYRMAVLLDPETLDWQMGLARSFFKQQRYAEAAAILDAMIARHPDRSDLWLLQANAYLGLQQPLRAAQNFELVDSLGKSTADSLNVLGDIYVNESSFDQAAEAYARSLAVGGKKAIDRSLRNANELVFRNAQEETSRLLDELVDLFLQDFTPDQRKTLMRLRARLAVAKGASEEHVAALLEIIEIDPLDGGALILLGEHYMGHDEPERAIFYFERAAQISEEFEATATRQHGQLLVRQGNPREALRLLRRSLELKPTERLRQYIEDVEKFAAR